MEFEEVIQEIQALPRTKPYLCCGRTTDISTLEIYTVCPTCHKQMKLRGFGAPGCEIQDVIDAVLKWMGTGKDLDLALARKKQIDQWPAS